MKAVIFGSLPCYIEITIENDQVEIEDQGLGGEVTVSKVIIDPYSEPRAATEEELTAVREIVEKESYQGSHEAVGEWPGWDWR